LKGFATKNFTLCHLYAISTAVIMIFTDQLHEAIVAEMDQSSR